MRYLRSDETVAGFPLCKGVQAQHTNTLTKRKSSNGFEDYRFWFFACAFHKPQRTKLPRPDSACILFVLSYLINRHLSSPKGSTREVLMERAARNNVVTSNFATPDLLGNAHYKSTPEVLLTASTAASPPISPEFIMCGQQHTLVRNTSNTRSKDSLHSTRSTTSTASGCPVGTTASTTGNYKEPNPNYQMHYANTSGNGMNPQSMQQIYAAGVGPHSPDQQNNTDAWALIWQVVGLMEQYVLFSDGVVLRSCQISLTTRLEVQNVPWSSFVVV